MTLASDFISSLLPVALPIPFHHRPNLIRQAFSSSTPVLACRGRATIPPCSKCTFTSWVDSLMLALLHGPCICRHACMLHETGGFATRSPVPALAVPTAPSPGATPA